jgi:hypothetical protein
MEEKEEEEIEIQEPYPLPFDEGYEEGANFEAKSLVELMIAQISRAIRCKEGWEQKMKNKAISKKWKAELQEEFEKTGDTLPAKAFDYVFQELEWYATQKDGKLQRSCVDGVWEADGIILPALTEELVLGVSKLENVPDEQKDWHPGSDEQV